MAALLVALAACKGETRPLNSCTSDADCAAAGTRCNTETQQCICVIDEACREGQFCNSSGVCQNEAGCTSSFECTEAGTYCEVITGQCVAGSPLMLDSLCGVSTVCPYGSVCRGGKCEAGCFDNGDCVLGQLCLEGECVTGANICGADAFCDYRERCVGNECKRDFRGPYCRGCSQPTALNPTPCDDPRNFCLVNNRETGGFPQYCGVDCSLGQPCPNGYDCFRVLILTDDTCTNNAQCKCDPMNISFGTNTCTVAAPCVPTGNGISCQFAAHPSCNPNGGEAACLVARGLTTGSCLCDSNDDCPNNGACVDGLCCTGNVNEARECRGGEGAVSGFCNCVVDSDCPRDSCDSTRGFCAISGRPCTPGNNDCGALQCIDGACLIGSNCAPAEGLSCSIVTSGG